MKLLKYYLMPLIMAIGILSSCENEIKEDIFPVVTQSFSASWKFHAGEGTDGLWMNPNYDDSSWQDALSTQSLNDQGLPLEQGFGWYRKKIQFNDSLQYAINRAGAIILRLGRLAACDEVYVNGKLIGKTGEFPPNYMGSFGEKRNYLVPQEDLKLTEENLIAIKFNEGWGTQGGFIDSTMLSVSSATTNEKLVLDAIVLDSDYIFQGDDPIKIDVNILNNNAWSVSGKLFVVLTTDDYKVIKTDSLEIKIKEKGKYIKEFSYHNPNPGFYKCSISFERNGEKILQKKFNVGYEPEKIESPLDAKADFKEFWDNNLRKLKRVSPRYKLTPVPEASQLDYEMYLVEMYSFGDELIRGYYAKPKKEGTHPVIVEYMGYGSSPYFPNQSWDGFAYFVLSVRGQALNQPTNKYGKWITYGLDNKNKYYYRGAFLDVVRALDFVCSRLEIDCEKIAVRGGSQGGALSFVAAALDKRVKVAAPNIPFLSDYPDYFEICPWPKNDFQTYIQDNPNSSWEDIYSLLTYFDIKNLAQWIECPLIMGIGVQDNVCPPHINFAAYNQVRSEKSWIAFPEFGHSVGKEFYDTSMNLFRQKLGVEKPN